MTHDDDQPFRKVFDVRQVNLTKLDKVIDLEIIVSECDRAIAGIKRQIKRNGDRCDPSWKADAMQAVDDIEHKKALAVRKAAAVMEAKAKAAPPVTPEQNFKSRFMKAAEELLDRPVFAQIFEAARFKGEMP